jgi:ATP-binding cassette subfamily G (WHITE) protein 2
LFLLNHRSKTSLLNILAARTQIVGDSKLTGAVLVNGKPRQNNVFKAISAYVQQDDVLFAHLTVKETLMLSAHFYLASTVSTKEKEDMVEAVIMELGLAKAKNTIIGNDKERGVSGGERKRANIGVELISDPAVLFLDEPTSGLDSFQAQSVMAAMKTMASNGRLIMSVIHQPRSSIFAMFDQMLLISEGRTVYYGDAADAVQYFENQGYPCPVQYNPADYFLDVLSMDYRTKEAEAETRARINALADKWNAAPSGVADMHLVPLEEGALAGEAAAAEPTAEAKLPHITYRSAWWVQFSLLFWRSFNEIRRNKMATGIKFVTTIFFALILAAIYQDLGDDQNSIQDRIGLLFFITINQCFGAMFGVLNTFPEERKVVNRERAGKAYRMSSYYVAKFLAELPFNILPPFLFG